MSVITDRNEGEAQSKVALNDQCPAILCITWWLRAVNLKLIIVWIEHWHLQGRHSSDLSVLTISLPLTTLSVSSMASGSCHSIQHTQHHFSTFVTSQQEIIKSFSWCVQLQLSDWDNENQSNLLQSSELLSNLRLPLIEAEVSAPAVIRAVCWHCLSFHPHLQLGQHPSGLTNTQLLPDHYAAWAVDISRAELNTVLTRLPDH